MYSDIFHLKRQVIQYFNAFESSEVYKTIIALMPSEQPHVIGAWTLQGVESVPQECWPMLTPMLPTVVSSWLDVLWVMDHSWYTHETVEREKPNSVAVLDTLKSVRLAPTTIPQIFFCLSQSPSERHSYTIHVSPILRYKHPSLPISSPSSALIVTSIRFHSIPLVSQCHGRAGVPNVLYAQCTLGKYTTHLNTLTQIHSHAFNPGI
jgi:hypothetical protein